MTLLVLAGCASGPDKVTDLVLAPFTRAHGLIFVELHAPGLPPFLALFDTGASASAIDGRRAADLPVIDKAEVVGTTGSLHAEIVKVEGLSLGSITLPSLRATRRDLSGLLSPDQRPVDVILGSDALSELVVTIDFHDKLLAIIKRSPESQAGVPMVLDNGIPTVPATLGGIEVLLRIDTGASLFDTPDVYVNIPSRTWSALRDRIPSLTPSTHFKGTGADGSEVPLPVARVSGARIGPLQFDSVFVIVQPDAGYFADPQAKGFVGNNYLEKLGKVTLDYPGQRLRSES